MGVSKRSLYQMRILSHALMDGAKHDRQATMTEHLRHSEARARIVLLRVPHRHRRLCRLMTWG